MDRWGDDDRAHPRDGDYGSCVMMWSMKGNRSGSANAPAVSVGNF